MRIDPKIIELTADVLTQLFSKYLYTVFCLAPVFIPNENERSSLRGELLGIGVLSFFAAHKALQLVCTIRAASGV